MIKTPYLLILAFVLQLTLAFGQSKSREADKIIGTFWSPKKDAKIEIYKKGESYFGKSIWVAIPRKDIENPNASLRKRDVLGIDLLSNFSYSDGEYGNGLIYDPESGKTYNCKMSLIGDKLKVRGYIGISLFGRTEYFEHIKSK
ncbi:DUF2147 domain-containing protein [Flavobacterium sp. ZS1P14]|uniref:DUF2147 domain-containing protein n=1 Tax=Flavobacterium sp. ZS1P14 TaxID=3401729 RepID=UPI003AAE5A94